MWRQSCSCISGRRKRHRRQQYERKKLSKGARGNAGGTLSISTLKNAGLLNAIGGELAEKYRVPYLFSDFKKRGGYQRSVELSREYGLYRQDYCGCVFSRRERQKGREN